MPDFARDEYFARTRAAQAGMKAQGMGALLITTEADFRYFTGFRTPFWQSPTRSWFLVIPEKGDPIAVIPGIGAALMQTTWVPRVATFNAPSDDDRWCDLLCDALDGAGTIGMAMSEEASLRMPLQDFWTLQSRTGAGFMDATPILKALRTVKSEAEIALHARICAAAGRAFARVPEFITPGMPLTAVFRDFRIALLLEGAEDVPYLVGGADEGGYADIIGPPTERRITRGDVLMLDTGATIGGYFCDFDRNFAVGRVSDEAASAHARLWDATEAALQVARPGVTAAELFAVMHDVLGGGDPGSVGRYGHGLGTTLTEWPSLAPHDHTEIVQDMCLTLEPSIPLSGGRMMVTEENIRITADGAQLLSPRCSRVMPVIGDG